MCGKDDSIYWFALGSCKLGLNHNLFIAKPVIYVPPRCLHDRSTQSNKDHRGQAKFLTVNLQQEEESIRVR